MALGFEMKQQQSGQTDCTFLYFFRASVYYESKLRFINVTFCFSMGVSCIADMKETIFLCFILQQPFPKLYMPVCHKHFINAFLTCSL